MTCSDREPIKGLVLTRRRQGLAALEMRFIAHKWVTVSLGQLRGGDEPLPADRGRE